MAGTEVMFGVGTDSLATEKVPEHLKTPEKSRESGNRAQSVDTHAPSEEQDKISGKGTLPESPGKTKGGTPKKNDPRNVFAGLKQSPKKNPWTRNTQNEGGREGTKEAARGCVAMVQEVGGEGKGIEIPKGEVPVHVYVSFCVWEYVIYSFLILGTHVL